MSTPLHPLDAGVIVIYLLSVVGVGSWFGRGPQTTAHYLFGNRDLPWWALLGSIVATETSTVTFLSIPGLAFSARGDLRFLQLTWGYCLGRIIVAYWLLPAYFAGQIGSAYEILHQRLGGMAKVAAASIFLVTRNLGDGLRLLLTAIVVAQLMPLSLASCIIIVGLLTTAYTLIGGMKAVVWNDCLQFVIYIAGALAAGWVIVARMPHGWLDIWHFAMVHDKLRLVNLDLQLHDPYSLWAGVIGGTFLSMGTHGTDQMMVHRYLCARSLRDARRALIASGAVIVFQFTLFLALGIGLASYYDRYPTSADFRTGDFVFAHFIVRDMPAGTGLIGLVLAAVFAAAMSTISSSINASAASFLNDIYRPLCSGASGEVDRAWVWRSRWLTLLFGIIQIGVGLAAVPWERSVIDEAMSIAGFASGILLGVFALGMLVPAADSRAALIGISTGTAILLVCHFGPALFRFPPDVSLAWPWYPLVGSATVLLAGMLATRLLSRPI